MRTLFPEIQPYARHQLKVDGLHHIYLEESGNPRGIPVLFVHGGPGAGCDSFNRRFFDPEKYRIVLFDQRGCGHSTPHAELTDNTTPHLLSDMEQIRSHLNVEQWLLFGGSWGATLSLLYAQQHPDRVAGLILRGTFLCRQQDIDWLYQSGANRFFPDHWNKFAAPIPADERSDLVAAYHRRLSSDNDLERMAAAKAWCSWEAHCSTLNPSTTLLNHYTDPQVAGALALIENHYFTHQGFIEENQILAQAERIAQIPAVLIHGRYDTVCPPEQAFALYQSLPDAELHLVRDAGHSALEPGITDNLIKATEKFATRLA
ncbi:prolyl aminopeptidase [Motiliproteus sediminis]|uniref:prolyl aminopeptidase n=1 Tax=Motiliproteus sediminis TaxID=1468178 RepID=UPI001AEF41DB|nr:prolyl aminopeptidase [Motiliproteus sediminis]